MRLWSRFKSWVKRSVIRVVLRFAHTRVMRYLTRIAKRSLVPLSITAGGAAVGVGVAYAIAFPLWGGALIGVGVAVGGILLTNLYYKYAEESRARQRSRLNYTIWSKKDKTNSKKAYVIEASPSSRRF